jgi:glucose/arabinose dehydrogenase
MAIGTALLTLFAIPASHTSSARAGQEMPTMLDENLQVRAVATGLTQPTTMAFLGPDDFLVLEKGTGQVQRVADGVVRGPVLDLAVNFASERGLLGIALHPDFPVNPGVYLYWSESSTGADTNALDEVPLLGNRVDRFIWDGMSLTFEQEIIRLRAYQADEDQPLRGNHDGGVIAFGPDDKLYVHIGDVGRRGQLQNLPRGPYDNGEPDDQFGGPMPDDAHLSGVILRLNEDGSTPDDNPFFAAGAQIGGEVGRNVQKIFSYGHRNGFGMAFDPYSGLLWMQENGDDSFSELNVVTPGFNGGWVQVAGPLARIDDFKLIETAEGFFGLQQIRWLPTEIADTPEEAISRLFVLPGARYQDPALSWLFEIAPAGMGFLNSSALGPEYEGDLFMGGANANMAGGYLFRFELADHRQTLTASDPRLVDGVADNTAKYDITESESLLVGSGFGAGTHIRTGPNGNLYVVSLTHGAIYEISRAR